jgi:hypothetical protein
MDIASFQRFLVAQQNGFEAFLKGCGGIDEHELRKELEMHVKKMQRALATGRPLNATAMSPALHASRYNTSTTDMSSFVTPAKKDTPSKRAEPSRSALSLPSKPAAASALFSDRYGEKRRRFQHSDSSSSQASEDNKLPGSPNHCSTPTKRRLTTLTPPSRAQPINQDDVEKSWEAREKALAINQAMTSTGSPVQRHGFAASRRAGRGSSTVRGSRTLRGNRRGRGFY